MAIQSTVEAMVNGVFEADAERLETVNSEVQRLSRLVDALLKLSRLENRATPMKEEVVDVGELIQSIVSTHEAFVADSGLTFEYRAEKGVLVVGDPDMIRQATANLISNAVRNTPEGGHVSVTVSKGDIMASIAVRDTGIGLSPEEAKMVFSRFWRADAGRNRASGGLGIGLAVVKEIVDRHGGGCRSRARRAKAPASRSISPSTTSSARAPTTSASNKGSASSKSSSTASSCSRAPASNARPKENPLPIAKCKAVRDNGSRLIIACRRAGHLLARHIFATRF